MPLRRHRCWRGQFQGGGYRFTKPREVILNVLSQSKSHLSAEDIFLLTHKQYSNIGLTTVYRTLELLVQMGTVLKYNFGDGKAHYELSQKSQGSDHHHHHLICRQCQSVMDYKDFMKEEKEFLEKVEKGLSRKYNFQIDDHLIHFYGLCQKCQTP